jgi:hypothetical protein
MVSFAPLLSPLPELMLLEDEGVPPLELVEACGEAVFVEWFVLAVDVTFAVAEVVDIVERIEVTTLTLQKGACFQNHNLPYISPLALSFSFFTRSKHRS